jgi:tetratricopeptide (TPR) repeat protein
MASNVSTSGGGVHPWRARRPGWPGCALLYDKEGDHRKALACFRWVTISGLADRDERFFFVRFNQALEYALLSRAQPALACIRRLLDRHPGRAHEVAELILKSKCLQGAIESMPGFGQSLLDTCPELFQAPDVGAAGGTGLDSSRRADGGGEPQP